MTEISKRLYASKEYYPPKGLGRNVVITDECTPVRTSWNWRSKKEEDGFKIGYCDPICSNGEARASEYIPVKFKNGIQLVHKSKLVRR